MDVSSLVLAAGALGTASFGIVEGLKWTPLGRVGFSSILKGMPSVETAFEKAYGSDYRSLLKNQYMGDQEDLGRLLRQGVRLGLSEKNALEIAAELGLENGELLKEAANKASEGNELDDQLRNVIGRFELAVDARIEANMVLAQNKYVGVTRVSASFVSIILALWAAYTINLTEYWNEALIAGIAAVPLAPIAKDVATALQEATKALRKKT